MDDREELIQIVLINSTGQQLETFLNKSEPAAAPAAGRRRRRTKKAKKGGRRRRTRRA
jgi:hypothetical protein